MAKTLLVKTRNGSAVIANTAGMESTAKIRSVTSTRISATASGVSSHLPAGAASTTGSGFGSSPGSAASRDHWLPALTMKCWP